MKFLSNSLKCKIAGLAVLVAAVANADVPARFCEYLESSPGGSTAPYVNTGLKPHYVNGKFFVDFALVDTPLPSKAVYLFGSRYSTGINNSMMSIALDASGNFRLEALYANSTSKYATGGAATPGSRYCLTVRKRYNYGGGRCNIENMTSGQCYKYGSSYAKNNAYAHQNFCFFSVNIGGTVSADAVAQRLYSAKIWVDGTTLDGDYIPCVDSSGNFGLYNIVDGSIKLVNSNDKFSASVADSPLARVVNGEVEFCTHVEAEAGAQVSADGGMTWGSSVDVWTKPGGDPIAIMARNDPSVPFAVFTGWRPDTTCRLDLAGASGETSATLTLPAGKVRRISATAHVGGYAPNAQFIANGNFETYDYNWHGGGAWVAASTTYASTKVGSMGSYVWGVDYGTANMVNPDLRRYNISLPPAAYKFQYGAAVRNVNSIASNPVELTTGSEEAFVVAVTNTHLKAYTTYAMTFTNDTSCSTVLRMSRTVTGANGNSNYSLDNLSLTMQLPISGVVVTAEPELYQVASAPSYNWFPMQDGRTDTFTAPSGVSFLNADESIRGFVRGYRVDTYNLETGTWTTGEEVASLSYAHTQSANECKRLVWLWTSENKISVTSQSTTELVSTNGTDWVQSLEEWYPYGSTASIYAGTTYGRLYFWNGLPSGTEYGERSATLGVPMNAPRSITLLDNGYTVTHVWAGPSADFLSDSAWRTPSGGATTAPTSDSVVFIPPGSTCNVSHALSVGGLYVGDVLKTGSSGTVTMTFSNGLTTNEVSGAVVVGKGATLTHTANPSGASLTTGTYKLCLKAASITVESGGAISADDKGYQKGKWPAGSTTAFSHGGRGTGGGKCYGSIREPMELGAGGQNNNSGKPGGGAIYLEATGDVTVNGTVTASVTPNWDGAGCGGSVFIKCGTLYGTGNIYARTTYGNSQGGGGRIAIYQSVARSWSGFTGVMHPSAYYSSTGGIKGSPGTIYRECAADVPTEGDLIIAGDASYSYPQPCALDPLVTDGALPFGRVYLKNKTYFLVPDGATLKVRKGLYVSSGATFKTGATSGRLQLVPAAGETCVVTGAVPVTELVCNAPGANIAVGKGSKITVAAGGLLQLSGSAENPLNLLPMEADKTWQLSVGADISAESLVEHVAASNCNASASQVTAYSSYDLGGNTNWAFIEPARPGDVIVWTGGANTGWTNGANWDRSRAPLDTDVIVIPAECPRYPVIGAALTVNTVTIASGASITLNAADFIVTNNFTCEGSVVANNDSKLVFTGDGEQTVDLANGSYSRIEVTKDEGSVAFTHGFAVAEMRFETSGQVPVTFAAGETVAATRLNVFGLVPDGLGGYANGFTFASSVSDSPWLLNAGILSIVRGINVSDCNASAGSLVKAGALCANGGGNTNWDFASDGAAFWTGGAETADFLTPENWWPQAVPSSSTFVQITPAATAQSVTLPAGESEVEIESLVMKGERATGSFAVRSKLAIAGNLEIGTNSTLNLDYKTEPNTVGGFCKILRGGTISHTALPSSATTIADGVYAINLAVAGDMTVYAGGSVNATMKGYAKGKGPGSPGTGSGGASHGSEGSNGKACYGSIFEPVTHGSGGSAALADYGKPGGGVIKIDVAGDLTVSGSILADSGPGSNAHDGGGAGGSVFLKCATLRGAGTISARGNLQGNAAGGAGRIAIYQRTATDWTEFTGTIPLNSAVNNNLVSHPIYLQCANDAEHGGTLYVRRSSSTATTYRKVWLMPSYDGGASAYRNMAIVLEGGVLSLSDTSVPSGKRMPIRDLDAKTSTSYIYCNGRIVTVLSRAHKNCKGWASTYETHVIEGGGKVRWATHLTISIR